MKSMLLHFEDDYAAALSLLATKFGKSRKQLIEEMMIKLVDQNPDLLAHVKQEFNMDLSINSDRVSRLKAPDVVNRYKVYLHEGGYDFMEGVTIGAAVEAFYGRKVSPEEFNAKYKDYEAV